MIELASNPKTAIRGTVNEIIARGSVSPGLSRHEAIVIIGTCDADGIFVYSIPYLNFYLRAWAVRTITRDNMIGIGTAARFNASAIWHDPDMILNIVSETAITSGDVMTSLSSEVWASGVGNLLACPARIQISEATSLGNFAMILLGRVTA